MVSLRSRDTHTFCWAFSSGAVPTCVVAAGIRTPNLPLARRMLKPTAPLVKHWCDTEQHWRDTEKHWGCYWGYWGDTEKYWAYCSATEGHWSCYLGYWGDAERQWDFFWGNTDDSRNYWGCYSEYLQGEMRWYKETRRVIFYNFTKWKKTQVLYFLYKDRNSNPILHYLNTIFSIIFFLSEMNRI